MLIAAMSVVVLAAGCIGHNHAESARVSFVTKIVPIEFTFPAGWNENSKVHPYDLQCMSADQRLNTGVFVFPISDLAAGTKPLEIFWEQVDDLKGKRKNLEEIEGVQTRHHKGKTITSLCFSGEKDLSRNYYAVTLIEFEEDKEVFAVAIQVALPSEWNEGKSTLQEIIESARVRRAPASGERTE
jgi:acid stress-induced BolA-like protein IbaG/YrbA